ncbi:hypothetical protein CFC21_032226 [Triticum aestivum]|uniref:Protein kinase domain-containing protein n=2 Tax=Triticum aestivum TaxID=4565 RepID=A0A3B6DLK4_WHEAT|nr:hypothetical protein CFC21_032226 [Triticum aestivum]
MCAHATSGKPVSRTPQAKLVVPALMALQLIVATVAAVPLALPGCPEACGRVIVPYPFGFRQGCFHAGFNLTCDETRHPPKLLLGNGVEVDAISLVDGTVHVQSKTVIATRSGPMRNSTRMPSFINSNGSWVSGLTGTGGQQLALSSEHNGPEEFTSCSGVGCCQTMFKDLVDREAVYQVTFKDLDYTDASYQPSESVATLIVDREWFNGNAGVMLNNTFGSYDHHWGSLSPGAVPTVLIWWLEQERDRDIVFYDPNISHWRCLSLNSVVTYVNGFAIRCSCLDGYEGNPYMRHGCQDSRIRGQPLTSLMGAKISTNAYSQVFIPAMGPASICQGHTDAQQRKESSTYQVRKTHSIRLLLVTITKRKVHVLFINYCLITIIAIAAGFGLLSSVLGVAQVTKKLKKRRAKKFRQKLFKKNHGLLLQQLISSNKDIAEKMKIFSLQELEQATNKFDHNRILGGGGHGTVYKGILSDQRVVAIKKAKIVVQREIDQDIKCANILLTDTLTSKVSDFGASRSIAIDETGILTAVQGTYGYLDPKYYYTSRFTEKSDVYSFGVILAELLTRVTSVFSSHSSEVTCLASHFVSLIRDSRFFDIVDTQIVEEGGAEDAEVVARLAETCLNLRGEERPTMRQVETTLEDVQSSRVHLNSQITRVDQNAINDQSYKGSKCGEGTRLYSLEKEFIQSSKIPR